MSVPCLADRCCPKQERAIDAKWQLGAWTHTQSVGNDKSTGSIKIAAEGPADSSMCDASEDHRGLRGKRNEEQQEGDSPSHR